MPAALELTGHSAGRRIANAGVLAGTFSFAGPVIFTRAVIFAAGLANSLCDTISEAFPDTQAYPEAQTVSVAQA